MLSNDIQNLTDEEALGVAALYPTWNSKIDESVYSGDRLWYDGKLYKVIQNHTIQSDWTPDVTASLYVLVSIEEWPEFVHPTGVHDAYQKGDKVTYNGKHYVSVIDNNTYSPEEYALGWDLQS